VEQLELVVAGYNEIFARVPGLPRYDGLGGVINILGYEPKAIEPPTMYTVHDSDSHLEDGQLVADSYNLVHRLCWQWVDNEQAEAQIRPFRDLVIKAVEADPLLGGRITQGRGAMITGSRSVFVTIGGTIYRALDFTSLTVCKRSRVPRYVP